MRCVTLANALRQKGHSCQFICRQQPGDLTAFIASHGHQISALPTAKTPPNLDIQHGQWLGCGWHEDAVETAKLIESVDWLVVDHYGIDARWETSLLLTHACRIFVIDDLADRPHACTALLDQNLEDKRAHYLMQTPANCKLLLGPQYALLRPEFLKARERASLRNQGARRILVFMGGADIENVTTTVLKALCSLPKTWNLEIVAVVGATNPNAQSLVDAFGKNRQICLAGPGTDMAELMLAADLAIGAAGTTSWERCCLGLPTIVVSLARNQNGIAESLQSAGVAIRGSMDDSITIASIANSIRALLSAPEKLSQMSSAAFTVVDGHGVERVLGLLESIDEN